MINELDSILNLLGPYKNEATTPETLIEFILDRGRPLQFRYLDGYCLQIEDIIIEEADIERALRFTGPFGHDNRAGIDQTLHRISRIMSKDNKTVLGLTCRVGRTVEGNEKLILDLLKEERSILVIGKPGAGKTSMLRSASKYMSDSLAQNVIIVDTSDEIAGPGLLPHNSVGGCRKMPVPWNKSQHEILLEAVQNHMPGVLVVDEISDKKEVMSINTIARRGVQILGTCHGNTLTDVLENDILRDLLGGVKHVTVGDKVAAAKYLGKKDIKERSEKSAFTAVVEIVSYNEVCIYTNVEEAVDTILSGGTYEPEKRILINERVESSRLRTLKS